MAVLAHPDDETLALGGTLAKYAAEGVETYLLMATRGERGWFGDPAANPGLAALGQIRETELMAAAKHLGLSEVAFLDYIDGDLDRAEPSEAVQKIAAYLRLIRPQVVVTFDPYGLYGHPDHIAISQLTLSAVMAAADPFYAGLDVLAPHRVLKLYYLVDTEAGVRDYEGIFGEIAMTIDGVKRRSVAWADWSVTTRLDTTAYWQQVWAAVNCHQTQLPGLDALQSLPDAVHRRLWGQQAFYRAFSLVNGGRAVEDDLFEGLRIPTMQNGTR